MDSKIGRGGAKGALPETFGFKSAACLSNASFDEVHLRAIFGIRQARVNDVGQKAPSLRGLSPRDASQSRLPEPP